MQLLFVAPDLQHTTERQDWKPLSGPLCYSQPVGDFPNSLKVFGKNYKYQNIQLNIFRQQVLTFFVNLDISKLFHHVLVQQQ